MIDFLTQFAFVAKNPKEEKELTKGLKPTENKETKPQIVVNNTKKEEEKKTEAPPPLIINQPPKSPSSKPPVADSDGEKKFMEKVLQYKNPQAMLDSSLEKFVNAANSTRQNYNNVVTSPAFIKTKHTGYWLAAKAPWIIFISVLLGIWGLEVITQIHLAIESLVFGNLDKIYPNENSTYQFIMQGMKYLLSWIVISSILLLAYSLDDEKTAKWLYNWCKLYGGLILIIFAGTLLFWGPDSDQTRQEIGENTETGIAKFFKDLRCNFDPTGQCQRLKATETTATVPTENKHELYVGIPYDGNQRTFDSIENFRSQQLIFSPIFTSTQPIILESFDCYYSIDGGPQTLFHQTSLQGETVISGKDQAPKSTMRCSQLDQIKFDTTTRQDVKIRGILTFKVQTKITQEFPSIDYELFIAEHFASQQVEVGDPKFAKKVQSEVGSDKKGLSASNLFEEVKTRNLNDRLPMVLGDGESEAFTFILSIEEKAGREFADFVEGEIEQIKNPPGSITLPDTDYQRSISFGSDKIFEVAINVEEDDTFRINQIESVQILEVPLIATFERKDSFTVTVNPTPEEIAQIRKSEIIATDECPIHQGIPQC